MSEESPSAPVGWLGFLVEQARLSIASSRELATAVGADQSLAPEALGRVVRVRRGTAICYATLGLVLPFCGTAALIARYWWTPEALADPWTLGITALLSVFGLALGFRLTSLLGLFLASVLVRLYVRSLEK
jgi:hypothetical protein